MTKVFKNLPLPEIGFEKATGLLSQELINHNESLKEQYFQINRVNKEDPLALKKDPLARKRDLLSDLLSLFAKEEIDIASAAAEAALRKSDVDGNNSISQSEYNSAFSIVDKEYAALRKYLGNPSCQDPDFTPGLTRNLLGSQTARDCLKKYVSDAKPAKPK